MSRADTGYLLMFLVIAVLMAMWFLSRRFVQYHRAVRRGDRHAKPVWKPFWMT